MRPSNHNHKTPSTYSHKIRCTNSLFPPEEIEEEIREIREEWDRFRRTGDYETLSVIGSDLTILEGRLKNARLYIKVCKDRDEARAKTAR